MNHSLFARLRPYAPLPLRLAFGFQLVKVSWPNALQPAQHMPEFITYQQSLGIPFPVVGSYLASYAEFLGGILLLLGLWTRYATVALFINFNVAFWVAHIATADTYQNTFPSANLIAASIFFFINGPGKFSVDEGL